nr:TldD/PmbA family protein [Geodermatophilaceae bacterium]
MSSPPPVDLATRVLELVRRAHPSAQAAVTVSREALALTRFAESFIHQNVVDETDRVQLMVHVDGRTALVEGNRTGPDELAALVASTLAAAALSARDEAFPGLAPAAPLLGTGGWDEVTAVADPSARAVVVREFVDAAAGLACAGYCQTALVRAAFANTAGQAVQGASTEASVSAIARTGRSDGVAR